MPYHTRPSAILSAGVRPVTLIAPNGYDPLSFTYPIVLILHNYGSTGAEIIGRLALDEAHNMDNGCFVISPDGQFYGGNRYWDYWTPGGDFTYLTGLITEAISLGWKVDATRIYGVGYSNGAFMVRQIADQNPSTLTATFTMGGGLSGTNDLNATGVAVPGVHWHGDTDTTVLTAGDATAATLPGILSGHGGVGSSGYKSASATDADMATRNGVGGGLAANYGSINFVTADGAGAETTRRRYEASTNGTAVERWTGVGVDHTVSLAVNQGQKVFEWLQRNHRGAV